MSTLTLTNHHDLVLAYRHRDFRQAMYDEGSVVMADVLLTLHGADHKARRKLVNRIFGRAIFSYYEREVIPQLIERSLAPFLAVGHADLIELGYRTSMNFTAHFAGIDLPAGDVAATDELLELVRKFSEGATMVHSTRDKAVVRSEVLSALEVLDDRFLAHSIARRTALIDEFEAGLRDEASLLKDVLTVLLRNEDSLHLPHDVLRREMAFYLQAGAHSTVNSTAHAMHDLFTWASDHPEDAARMRAEPLFLQRCVHESMRLNPASPVAWRRPTRRLRFECSAHPEGIELGPDDLVVLELQNANRDTTIFGADAACFNPHRLAPEGHKPFGLSFGTGLHACLGQDLAAGLVPGSDGESSGHLLGTVPRLAWTLLQYGAQPDADDPATLDPTTSRGNWGRYPVRFTASGERARPADNDSKSTLEPSTNITLAELETHRR
jgi:cytochrome P450